MTNLNEITIGMTLQDKDIYFTHQEMRHKQEQEKIDAEKQHLRAYKEHLIKDILETNSNFTEDELRTKSIRTLERIF